MSTTTLGTASIESSVEASIVVVLDRDQRRSAASVDAAIRVAAGTAQVIVVADGGRALTSTHAAHWPDAHLVALDVAVPYAAAANRGASAAVGRVLCFVAPGAILTDGSLAPLLAAVTREQVVCAVPLVVSPDGRVVEAGCVLDREGTVAAVGEGDRTTSFEHAFPRPTDGGSRGCICIRRSSFVAVGGFDPSLDDPVVAGIDLSRTLHESGLRTVFEPASRVVVDEPTDHAGSRLVPAASTGGRVLMERWAATVPAGRPLFGVEPDEHRMSLVAREAGCRDRILVVAGSVPFGNKTHSGRRLAQVLSDLAAVVPDGRLTLLAFEGHHAARSAPTFLRRGIEVVAGPQDWDLWFRLRALQFSHLVITDLAALRRIDGLLIGTQPQARRILCLPSLDFEDVALATAGHDPADEAGTTLLVHTVRSQVERAARSFDGAWCATQQDRSWIEATAPGIACAVIPTKVSSAVDVAFERRSGYVVLAAPGADITAGHEDAALYAAREVLPALLLRDPSAFLRVVVDDPSPTLQLLAGQHVELVPSATDPARWFRRSRVCLAWYPRGSGSRESIALALDARTPFVTSAAAIRSSGHHQLAFWAEAGGAVSVGMLAERLHERKGLWEAFHDELCRLADGPHSASAARLKLLRACADAGIAPTPGMMLDEPVEVVDVERDQEALRPRNVSIVGSAWKAAHPAADGPVPPVSVPVAEGPIPESLVNEHYRRWLARYGPTTRRLTRLADRLAGLVRRPTISVVMPVFNSEASWLDAAIRSVRSQVYGNWELCIGDDGSTRQETIDVLESHVQEEPRVRLVRLPGHQGIAAASNAGLSLATGEFVGFLDHDDELKPHALGEIALALDVQPTLDMIYTDEDKLEPDGRLIDPFFKPDWSPDHLMSRNYVCHLLVLRRSLVDQLGGFRLGYDGSQDYDLVLRATELTTRIAHVAEPLYTWRKVPGSTAGEADAKPWAIDAARRALGDALDRRGTPGNVMDGMYPDSYRVRYALRGTPKVSILIPTRDRVDLLRSCIDSIEERSTYTNYEIVVVDNQSADPETLAYFSRFRGRVVRYPHRFNYARIMNLAAHEAAGDILLFLNNDTQVIAPEWLEAMIEHAQRPEVGIVGPRLRYPDGRPQHEGTIVGHKGGHAGNVDHGGYWGLGDMVRNCSAVTGACLMIRPSVYHELGGLEERLRIAWNDVDLCLRVRQAGYQVVYTPYAELFHVEGGTRGIHAHVDDDFFFEGRWVTHKCLDAYYNANLDRLQPFRIRT